MNSRKLNKNKFINKHTKKEKAVDFNTFVNDVIAFNLLQKSLLDYVKKEHIKDLNANEIDVLVGKLVNESGNEKWKFLNSKKLMVYLPEQKGALIGLNVAHWSAVRGVLSNTKFQNKKIQHSRYYVDGNKYSNSSREGHTREGVLEGVQNFGGILIEKNLKSSLQACYFSLSASTGLSEDQTNYRRSAFDGLDLSNSNWADALLEDATFRNCVLNNAIFHRANLQESNFENATAINASFAEAYIYGSNTILNHGNFLGSNFARASLHQCSAIHANFSDCDFYKANLKDADLRSANLKNADLRYAELINTNLDNANLFHAKNITAKQLAKAKNIDKIIIHNNSAPPFTYETMLKSNIPSVQKLGLIIKEALEIQKNNEKLISTAVINKKREHIEKRKSIMVKTKTITFDADLYDWTQKTDAPFLNHPNSQHHSEGTNKKPTKVSSKKQDNTKKQTKVKTSSNTSINMESLALDLLEPTISTNIIENDQQIFSEKVEDKIETVTSKSQEQSSNVCRRFGLFAAVTSVVAVGAAASIMQLSQLSKK